MARDVDRIKEKINLVDLIKSYINLSPAGKNFKGLCPFHQEKTPSFVVSPDRDIWHCFGCGKGGDLIEFVMEYENLEFPEALRFLADKAGIEIQSFSRKDQKVFDVLYEINEESKEFFKEELRKNNEALRYLLDRGLSKKTIKEFELGYSPGGESLTKHLLSKGHKIDEIEKAGISLKKKTGLYKDRFSERIIFPIISEIDRTVAFSGRIFTNKEVSDNTPKYLNSPATPIYNKSKILYGFNKSKPYIKKSKEAFVVEGYMDFLMLYQFGIKNVVASAGTSLTSDHLEKLKRITDTVILSFDNDSGGLRALEKSLDTFSNFDFYTKAVDLGKYKDPAEAVQNNSKFLEKSIKSAEPIFRRLFKHYFSKEKMDINERKKSVRHLMEKINKLDSAVEQDMWIKELSKHSGISETALKSEFKGSKSQKSSSKETKKEDDNTQKGKTKEEVVAERLLSLSFTKDNFFTIVKDNQNIFPDKYKEIMENPDNEKAKILDLQSSYLVSEMDERQLQEEFYELMRFLKINHLERIRAQLQKIMKKTKSEQDFEKAVSKFNEASTIIDGLKKGEIKPF